MLYVSKNSIKYCLACLLTFVVTLGVSQEKEDVILVLGDEIVISSNAVNKSCGAIMTPDSSSSIIGTGFVVDSLVITASHIIKGKKNLFYLSNNLPRPYPIELFYEIPGKDIAVLKFKENPKLGSLNLGRFEDLKMHSSVMFVGYNRSRNVLNKIASFPIRNNNGFVMDINELPGVTMVTTSYSSSFSGGPLFNGNGEVVGLLKTGYAMVNPKTGKGGPVAVVVSIDPLRKYLKSEGVVADNLETDPGD